MERFAPQREQRDAEGDRQDALNARQEEPGNPHEYAKPAEGEQRHAQRPRQWRKRLGILDLAGFAFFVHRPHRADGLSLRRA